MKEPALTPRELSIIIRFTELAEAFTSKSVENGVKDTELELAFLSCSTCIYRTATEIINELEGK
jgi:hypothetical protein